MAYVPGSHNAGGLIPVDITHPLEPYNILADPLICGAQPKWVDVEPGSVIGIMGLRCIKRPRTKAIACVESSQLFISQAMQPDDGTGRGTLDREQIVVGGALQGKGFHRVALPKLTEPAINGGRRNWAADPRLNRKHLDART